MKRPKRPRQADVAALAGVSPAIVSLVINGRVNGKVRISERTQQRVWAAVRQLGYVANPVARSLAGGRSRLLGVFTYEPVFPLNQQNFYYRFLVGIEEEAEAQDYDLLLFTRASGPNGRRAIYRDGINTLQLADGAVLIGTHEDRDELSRLLQSGFPFVFVGRREVPGGAVSYAAADYTQATIMIVEALVRLGHRRLAYFRQPHSNESAYDRELGYLLAHQQFNLPLDKRSLWKDEPENITAEDVRACLDAGFTALIAEHPCVALRLLSLLEALGKRVPADVSLAVLGNATDWDTELPGVTKFVIPRHEMGAQAVRLLVDMLDHPDQPGPHRITLPCTFDPGQTIAPPPSLPVT